MPNTEFVQIGNDFQMKITDRAYSKRMMNRLFLAKEMPVGSNSAKFIQRNIGLEGTGGNGRKSYWLLSQRLNGSWYMVNVNTAQALEVTVEFV